MHKSGCYKPAHSELKNIVKLDISLSCKTNLGKSGYDRKDSEEQEMDKLYW